MALTTLTTLTTLATLATLMAAGILDEKRPYRALDNPNKLLKQ